MAENTEIKPVEASFVFLDSLRNPISELDVVLKSASFEQSVVTDAVGLAWKSCDVKRNEKISVFVKKRDGKLAHKFNVVPDRDINAFTFKSAEFHFTGTTKITAEELLEKQPIPEIKVGEVMTIDRLFGELAPYVGSVHLMEDIGKVVKDFPTKKKIPQIDPITGKPGKPLIEIEHHYKVTKIEKPLVLALNVLGEKLNYPKSTEPSAGVLKSIADELGCEIAALRAVAATESGEMYFMENGLPKILFERHHFYKYTMPNQVKKKGVRRTPHPFAAFADICNPRPGGYGVESLQYAKLVKASRQHREAAIMSCSWGAFQVMGGFWEDLGYKSAEQLANECMDSADGQMKLFRNFLKMKDRKPAIDALKVKDWEKFTYYYNGSNWRNQNPKYPTKMADFYAEYKK
jgi:hypothetical protein